MSEKPNIQTLRHWFRKAVMCPACKTPQRLVRGCIIRQHKRETSEVVWFPGMKNRQDPPSLRGPGDLDDWSEPPGERTVYSRVWCEGSGAYV